jgi:uncharacterized membrane protein YgcG
MKILKNTYDKQQEENKEFSGVLSSLLKEKKPSRQTTKRHNKGDIQSFLKNYSPDKFSPSNVKSEEYSIPELEKEKTQQDDNQIKLNRKAHKPQLVEMDEKLSRILTLISPENNYYSSANNTQNNSPTTNNLIENYYLSDSPKSLTKSDHLDTKERRIIEKNNVSNSLVEKNVEKNNVSNSLVEKNVGILQKANPASLVNTKLIRNSITNHANDSTLQLNFHHRENNLYEENVFNNSKNQNVKFVPRIDKNDITKIHKDINIAKVLNNTENSYEYLPALKDGGVVTEATKVVVGEGGPEAIVPLDQMNKIMNQKFQTVQNHNKTITTSANESMTKNIFLKMNEELVRENVEKQRSGGLNVSSGSPNFSMGGGGGGGGQQGGSPSGGGGRQSIDALTLSLLRKTSLPPWRSSFG